MAELLAHPAIQAAIAPFIVSLAIALLFRRMGHIALGLAIIGGFFTTVLLTTGLALQPLTSTRKIILVSLCLPLLLPMMELSLRKISVINERWQPVIMIAIPTVLLVVAINWIIWPVLSRQETADAWYMSAGVSSYVGVLSMMFLGMAWLKQPEKSAAQGASIFALALGTAVTSMIAASALYSQWAFSIVAAVGSLLLISLFRNPKIAVKQGAGHLGIFGLFAAVVPLALIGAAATVYAQLSGEVLLCLLTIPVIASWVTLKIERPWLQLVSTGMLALLPIIPAVWLAWRAADSMSY